ncbi:MAG: hypothetical protein IH866_00765 [Chloroflexi bacterium]|nr:hypothetical protein [Chloroflexota bacterium]
MELKNVVLIDAARSAFARGGRGMMVATRLDEAGAHVLRAVMERNPKVKPNMVEDIGMGNVMGVAELAGIGANVIARMAGLPSEVCSFDSNRQCGSSMETLHRITQSIMVGATECGIALGIERMGRSLAGGGGGEETRSPSSTESAWSRPRLSATWRRTTTTTSPCPSLTTSWTHRR